MRATLICGAALLSLALATSQAHSQTYYSPVFGTAAPRAPDAYNPGPCATCGHGAGFCVRPPWPPFNGPGPFEMAGRGRGGHGGFGRGYGARHGNGPGAEAVHPSILHHPFMRSPRDFFMWGQNMEDARAGRPSLVP